MKNRLPLKPGSKYCMVCHGFGILGYTQHYETIRTGYKQRRIATFKEPVICGECNGDGQFDWVEDVVGKRTSTIDNIKVERLDPDDGIWKVL